MALVGNMIADAFSGNPSAINYSMFVAVFAMLSLFYLVPATVKDGLGAPLVMMGLDVANTLFFLCGGIALAAYLGVHSCSNDVRLPKQTLNKKLTACDPCPIHSIDCSLFLSLIFHLSGLHEKQLHHQRRR